MKTFDQKLSLLATIATVWHDPFMRWEHQKDLAGLPGIARSASRVWHPVLYVLNAADGPLVLELDEGTLVFQNRDGQQVIFQLGIFTVSCKLNLKEYSNF